jgi:hypothetical protein
MPLPEDSEPATLAALANAEGMPHAARTVIGERGLPPGLGVNLSADSGPISGAIGASMDHAEPDETR